MLDEHRGRGVIGRRGRQELANFQWASERERREWAGAQNRIHFVSSVLCRRSSWATGRLFTSLRQAVVFYILPLKPSSTGPDAGVNPRSSCFRAFSPHSLAMAAFVLSHGSVNCSDFLHAIVQSPNHVANAPNRYVRSHNSMRTQLQVIVFLLHALATFNACTDPTFLFSSTGIPSPYLFGPTISLMNLV